GLPARFAHDGRRGGTERRNVAPDGTQGSGVSVSGSISADGRFVAFTSAAGNLVAGDTNGVEDIFVHDRQTGVTERVSVASDGTQGNDGSFDASTSATGRFVAFTSAAANLVAGGHNGGGDHLVRRRPPRAT